MHLSLSFIFLDILTVFPLSTAAVGHLQVSQQPSILDTYTGIHIRDTAGPITINFYPPSWPALHSVELSNAPLESLTAFNTIIVGTLLVCLAIRAIFYWPSNYIASPTQTKSGPPPGRSSAVPDWPEFKVASPTQRQVRSLDEADLRTVLPQSEPLFQADPLTLEGPPHSDSRLESGSPSEARSSAEIILVAESFGPCIHHRRGCAITRSQRTFTQPKESVSKSYPNIHGVIAGSSFSSENIGSLSQDGDELPASQQPSASHSAPANNHASLASNLTGLIAAHSILALSLLVVGLDWAHDEKWTLPGVTHDIKWFKRICSDFDPIVALQTLTDANYRIIHSKILEMFNNARAGTTIILYFNGHGLGNSFLLYDGTRVDAVTVIEWITEIRQETNKALPVCIVFDHCRFEMRAPVVVDLGRDIHIIWACMPGQRSADIKMTGDEDSYIPCSNFLKVLTLVLDEARSRPTSFVDGLTSRMNAWMKAMVCMTRAEECKQNECPTLCSLCSCPNYDSCTHGDTRSRHSNPLAYPRIQNPNGLFWDSEEGVCVRELLQLAESAAKPCLDRIQETAKMIKSHEMYQVLNKPTKPTTSGNMIFQSAGLRTRRGKKACAAALPTLPLAI